MKDPLVPSKGGEWIAYRYISTFHIFTYCGVKYTYIVCRSIRNARHVDGSLSNFVHSCLPDRMYPPVREGSHASMQGCFHNPNENNAATDQDAEVCDLVAVLSTYVCYVALKSTKGRRERPINTTTACIRYLKTTPGVAGLFSTRTCALVNVK